MRTGKAPLANSLGRARTALVAALFAALLMAALPALAQSYAGNPFEDRPVGTVTVTIVNPSKDAALNQRITDSVRRSLALFPGSAFSNDRANAAVGLARRNPAIADVAFDLAPGAAGSLDVSVTVTLTDASNQQTERGYFLTGDRGDLPLLYDRNGTVLRYKLEILSLYYANDNAWYGQPRPDAGGQSAGRTAHRPGRGWSDWAEGLPALRPLRHHAADRTTFIVYGGLSAITSGSRGQELFTDEARSYTAVEDAYVGFVGGNTDETGNRLTFNLSAGRQRFTLANAFLIANTAANGGDRAALAGQCALGVGHAGPGPDRLEQHEVRGLLRRSG